MMNQNQFSSLRTPPPWDPAFQRELEEIRGRPFAFFTSAQLDCPVLGEGTEQPPVVSVAIITYNQAPFIAQTLNSILAQQTSFPFELVIGEDVSTDETRSIVLDFQKRYPRQIRVLADRANVGATLNNARVESVCRGRYIAYCEGDDFWTDPQKLQVQADRMDASPEISMVFTDGETIHHGLEQVVETTGYNYIVPGINSKETVIPLVLQGALSPYTCSMMVRRDCLLAAYSSNPLFWANLYLGDTLRTLEMASQGSLFYIPQKTVAYRIHSGGISHGDRRSKVMVDGAVVRYFHAQRDGYAGQAPVFARFAFSVRLNAAIKNGERRQVAGLLRACVARGLMSRAKAFGILLLAMVGMKRQATAFKMRVVRWFRMRVKSPGGGG
jgi:glycosyltransferase involved in cell wall biosynthesis